MVAMPFVGLLLGTLSVAFDLYVQFALDYSLQQAVRQVQLGLVPATMTAADFAGSVFCPVFVLFAPCNSIVISVQPVSDFYTAAAVTSVTPPTSFCVGVPGQLMYARAVYQAPALGMIYPLIASSSGTAASANAITSDAAFANENPAGASVTGAGGC